MFSCLQKRQNNQYIDKTTMRIGDFVIINIRRPTLFDYCKIICIEIKLAKNRNTFVYLYIPMCDNIFDISDMWIADSDGIRLSERDAQIVHISIAPYIEILQICGHQHIKKLFPRRKSITTLAKLLL